ncbi:MAG: triose-phosphate isomerase [Candidatus Krumholzibacteriota bacterium]|nr:triose-phosphate isomerase [Candidatus Krumholzibacteriota bacterium]
MGRIIVAGNWKMHKTHEEGRLLAEAIVHGTEKAPPACEIVLIPPFTAIPAVCGVTGGTTVRCGAQNLWHEPAGAFTGEISGAMLVALGCEYVLVGHSERRHVIGEEDSLLQLKLVAALEAGLQPILCVGETLEQREAGRAREIVAAQATAALGELNRPAASRVLLAYEPVWAIGTGKTATPEDAADMHGYLRSVVGDLFDAVVAEAMPILYGGSVKPSNAATLLGRPGIDGALVGGAALDAASFLGIVAAAPESR